ncbi:MAG: hypothetical protein JWO95_2809 [Verrucomicrobiales bacterium]|nr:hypothetical protein [Verrucomicrobiales bacterium]
MDSQRYSDRFRIVCISLVAFQIVALGPFTSMPSNKLLNGVTHDIAHHALSGLSWLHPHLTQNRKRAGLAELTLDLLSESPLPANVPDYQPLRLASQALHRTFIGIVESVGFTVANIASARLTFHVLHKMITRMLLAMLRLSRPRIELIARSYQHSVLPLGELRHLAKIINIPR